MRLKIMRIYSTCVLVLFLASCTSTRQASAPSDWSVCNILMRRPYEETHILIDGPDYVGEGWKVSGRTKIDNKEIGDEPQRGHLDVQGGSNSEWKGIQLVISWFPVFQFPKSLGEHPVDLVCSTTERDYHFPRFTVVLDATKEERRQIAEFEKSGANAFLNDAYGFTPHNSTGKKSMPYAAALAFVERHPDSYLTKVIERRVKLIWLWDVSGRQVPAAERRWLGKILGAMDKKRFVAEFRSHVEFETRGHVSKLWLDAVKAYRRGP